jgi:hypothetical protein
MRWRRLSHETIRRRWMKMLMLTRPVRRKRMAGS